LHVRAMCSELIDEREFVDLPGLEGSRSWHRPAWMVS
jgi:hypothetical protein